VKLVTVKVDANVVVLICVMVPEGIIVVLLVIVRVMVVVPRGMVRICTEAWVTAANSDNTQTKIKLPYIILLLKANGKKVLSLVLFVFPA
jgi:hypothetical protein